MKKSYLLLFLFELGWGIKFNVIGTITLSELSLPVFVLLILSTQNLFRKYPLLRKISLLYLGLLVSQVCSELILGNKLDNSLRGISATVFSYLHFIFLFSFFIKDRKNILYVLAGTIIMLALTSGKYTDSMEGIASDDDISTFLKFRLSPIIMNLLLILFILTKRKKLLATITILIGVWFIIAGARSNGTITLLTGILAYFILSGKKIDNRKLIQIAIMMGMIGYGLYAVYVNQVLTGNITAGNNEQILLLKNPYNPVNLLFAGRTETLIGWEAFMDSPLVGHGAWATDVTGYYRNLAISFRSDISIINAGSGRVIPSHSVIIGTGMYNGIFAFLFMGAILIFFIRLGLNAINKKDPYLAVIIFFIFSLLWNGLFSPVPHFKNHFPLFFAMILASYIINHRKSITKKLNKL